MRASEKHQIKSVSAKTEEVGTSKLTNQKWVLKRRPDGVFCPTKDVILVEEDLEPSACAPDEVIVECSVLSVDAFIRTMLDAEAYHGSVDLGSTLPALGYGRVVYAAQGWRPRIRIDGRTNACNGQGVPGNEDNQVSVHDAYVLFGSYGTHNWAHGLHWYILRMPPT